MSSNHSNDQGRRHKEKTVPEAVPLSSVVLVKTAVFVLLFLFATALFGWVCSRISQQYQAIFAFGSDFLSLALWAALAIGLFALTAGFLTMLVRPFWLVFGTFVLSSLILVWQLGFSTITLILGVCYLGLASLYAFSVVHKLENQINPSLHPLVDGQHLLFFIITLFMSASFALGYYNDAVRSNFIIPPSFRETTTKVFSTQLQTVLEKQNQLKGAEKTAALQKATDQVQKMWTDLEAGLKPHLASIPIILGLMMLMSLQIFVLIFSWIPLAILSALFPFLKAVHITHFVTETKEINRLRL